MQGQQNLALTMHRLTKIITIIISLIHCLPDRQIVYWSDRFREVEKSGTKLEWPLSRIETKKILLGSEVVEGVSSSIMSC